MMTVTALRSPGTPQGSQPLIGAVHCIFFLLPTFGEKYECCGAFTM